MGFYGVRKVCHEIWEVGTMVETIQFVRPPDFLNNMIKKNRIFCHSVVGCLTPAVSGAHMWVAWLHYPCLLRGPHAGTKLEVATNCIVTPPRGPGGRAYPCKRGDMGGARRKTRSSRHPAAAVLVRVGHTKPITKVGPFTDP